jgi:hypothetical protein
MVAQEDADTASVLAQYLTGLDVDISMQHIPPAGAPDFEPEALVVICGPGTSRRIAELLANDPVFDYGQDSTGFWRIRERESGREFRSPLDDGSASDRDIAYLGRLPRPDGRPFLLIAGLRAIGSLGVAQYLVAAQHLRELYDTVAGTHPFSMIIGCAFEPATLSIRSTEALTAPRLHT